MRQCWCGNAGVGSGGGVVAVSAYMGGTRGSGVFSSAGDVLGKQVAHTFTTSQYKHTSHYK